MNRQLRRAQAKLDKKAEIEKQRKREARQQKVEQLKERRRRQREEGKKRAGFAATSGGAAGERRVYTPEERKKLPGRFSGVFMFLTVFFIALQAATPAEAKTLGQSLIGAGFFLMYGYFSTLFLLRRGLPRAMTTAAVGGVTLAVVLGVMQAVQGQQVDWVLCAVGAVGVPLGAYLGRALFTAAPPQA